MDIHVRTLRDNQQFSDPGQIAEKLGVSPSTWPLFGLVWDSSRVLANLMATFDIEDKRILEAGCGIGLASLILNERSADITASDHNPEAKAFLDWNTDLNCGRQIPFARADWDGNGQELGEFDLIIGSDILYQRDHPKLLAGFINRHAKLTCQVIIIDPRRGNTSKFSKLMIENGFEESSTLIDPEMVHGYKGKTHSFSR